MSPPRLVRAVPLGLLLVLLARFALGAAYSLVVPSWEAYDEDGHFAYMRYLAVHRTLVLRPDDPEAAQIWERFQPPLYYDLIAPLIAGYDLGLTFPPPDRNPHFVAGDAGYNYALHPAILTASEQALAAALTTARIASVVLSTLSVVFVYLTARRVWPGAPGPQWAATCLFAFWPQWVFIGSMVNNDGLVTTLTALGVWLAVELVTAGFGLRRVFVLGGVVALALLTKLNGIVLVPTALAAVALSLAPIVGRRVRLRPAQLLAGLVGLAAGVAAAFWVLTSLEFVTAQVLQTSTLNEFIRNINPTGGGGAGDLVTSALPYAFRTFWASFGWGNVEIAAWLYWVWGVAALTGVVGLGLAGVRRRATTGRQGQIYLLCGLHVGALLALTLALAIAHQSVYLVPGRYLLPALPAVVLLLVGGWRELGRAWRRPSAQPNNPRASRRVWQAVSLAPLLIAWVIPLWTLLPAYARPVPLTLDTVVVEVPLTNVYAGQIELLGYSGPSDARAGEPLRVTLCWRAIAPVTANYSLFLEIVGADGQGYGQLLTYPGRGNYPTSAWVVAEPFCETYAVIVADAIPAPALSQLRVTWLDAAGEPLAGDETQIEFKVAARPGAAATPAQAVNFSFGGSAQYPNLRLTGYTVEQAGQEVVVTLRWEAVTTNPGDYVVFVHLRDTPTTFYTVGDSAPMAGAYPTGRWEPGEIIIDRHRLTLPSGPPPVLSLYVGLYNPAEDARVAVYAGNGERLPNDEIVLETGMSFR